MLPKLKGKLNGVALRVPTPTVSVVDLVVQARRWGGGAGVEALCAPGPSQGLPLPCPSGCGRHRQRPSTNPPLTAPPLPPRRLRRRPSLRR